MPSKTQHSSPESHIPNWTPLAIIRLQVRCGHLFTATGGRPSIKLKTNQEHPRWKMENESWKKRKNAELIRHTLSKALNWLQFHKGIGSRILRADAEERHSCLSWAWRGVAITKVTEDCHSRQRRAEMGFPISRWKHWGEGKREISWLWRNGTSAPGDGPHIRKVSKQAPLRLGPHCISRNRHRRPEERP